MMSSNKVTTILQNKLVQFLSIFSVKIFRNFKICYEILKSVNIRKILCNRVSAVYLKENNKSIPTNLPVIRKQTR